MSPVSNNYGSATIYKRSTGQITPAIARPDGCYGFVLGNNSHYSKHCFESWEVGDLFAVNNGRTRIDNPDFGTIWDPNTVKGMAVGFGSGRSQKGTGLIIPAALLYAASAVINDPKGQLAWITAPQRRKYGKVRICDFTGEVNRVYGEPVGVTEEMAKYNPLASIDPNALDFPEEVSGISESITIAATGGESAFFYGASRDLIEGVVAAVIQSSEPGQATFRKVRKIISLDDVSFGQFCAALCAEYPDTLASLKLADYIDMNRTNQGIKKTAKEQTKFLDSEQMLRFLEPGPDDLTFDFEELATGVLTVYIVVPPTQLITQQRFIRMMVNKALRGVLKARKKQPAPVLFLLDEAGTSLGHLDEIENAYGLTSGLGILVWSFYQDISQLKRDYPKSFNTFIGNSATIQLMEAKDQETSEFFSEYMGHMTVPTTGHGESIQPLQNLTPGARGGNVSTSTNWGEMGRRVMTADEIRTMPEDEMLAIFPKTANLRQFKIQYWSDARFNGMYRIDHTEGQTAYPAPVVKQYTDFPMEALQTKVAQPKGEPEFKRYIKPTLWSLVLLSGLRSCAESVGRTIYPTRMSHLQTLVYLLAAAIIATFVLKPKKRAAKPVYWWIDREGFMQHSTLPW